MGGILLKEMNFKLGGPMVLHCDSFSAIKLAKNPIYHQKTKQIGIESRFIIEKFKKKMWFWNIQVQLIILQIFLQKRLVRNSKMMLCPSWAW